MFDLKETSSHQKQNFLKKSLKYPEKVRKKLIKKSLILLMTFEWEPCALLVVAIQFDGQLILVVYIYICSLVLCTIMVHFYMLMASIMCRGR